MKIEINQDGVFANETPYEVTSSIIHKGPNFEIGSIFIEDIPKSKSLKFFDDGHGSYNIGDTKIDMMLFWDTAVTTAIEIYPWHLDQFSLHSQTAYFHHNGDTYSIELNYTYCRIGD